MDTDEAKNETETKVSPPLQEAVDAALQKLLGTLRQTTASRPPPRRRRRKSVSGHGGLPPPPADPIRLLALNLFEHAAAQRDRVGNSEFVSIATRVRSRRAADDVFNAELREQGQEQESTGLRDTNDKRPKVLHDALRRVPILKHMSDDTLRLFATCLCEESFAKNDVIIKEGDSTADKLYILTEGRCGVYKSVTKKKRGTTEMVTDPFATLLREMEGGLEGETIATFGEIALLHGKPRAVTVRAESDNVKCLSLARDPFRRALRATMEARRSKHLKILDRVAILSPLTKFERSRIADTIEPITVEQGCMLGDIGIDPGCMYCIEEGEVTVTVLDEETGSNEVEVLPRLGPGDVVAESALLSGTLQRVRYTVSGDSPAILLRLQRDVLTRVLGPLGDMLQRNPLLYGMYEEIIDPKSAICRKGGADRRHAVFSPDLSPALLPSETEPKREKSAREVEQLRELVRTTPLLRHLTASETDEFVNCAVLEKFAEGDALMRRGEEARKLYFISTGSVGVYEQEGVRRRQYGPGSMVGELSILYNHPRTATVIADAGGATCWTMQRSSIKGIIKESRVERINDVRALLRQVDILSPMTAFELSRLADAMEPKIFRNGEELITKGETSGRENFFTVIESGECKVTSSSKASSSSTPSSLPPPSTKSIGRSAMFGVAALLVEKAAPKTTVTATGGPVKVLRIHKDHFEKLVGNMKQILLRDRRLYRSTEKRLAQRIAGPGDIESTPRTSRSTARSALRSSRGSARSPRESARSSARTSSRATFRKEGGESDGSDGNEGEEDYTLLYKAAHFLAKDLDGVFDTLVEEHGHVFLPAVKEAGPDLNMDNIEHGLQFTELHGQYVAHFEGLLENFVVQHLPTMTRQDAFAKFFDEARDAMTGRFMPLFAEDSDLNRPFVDSVIAATEYTAFIEKMVRAVAAKRHKK
eukprot:g3364.t1